MSRQDILAMQKLITQKYQQYQPHLNPFCNLLFCDNWSWPSSSYLTQNYQNKLKSSPNKTSLKADITSWFLSLQSKQKCAFTAIKNPKFLQAFLQTYRKWNPDMLYHIYQKRQIPNYLTKNNDHSYFIKIIEHLRIAWLDQPIIYFQAQDEELQGLFIQFVNWVDQISGDKFLQYAHKVKNKSQPDQNLLWFTQNSFQNLPAWLVNQFEKVIIRNYYDRNNFDIDAYEKIERLKQGTTKTPKSSTNKNTIPKKQLTKLLNMKLTQTKNYTPSEITNLKAKLKIYEDQYYQEVALMMDYENSTNNGANNNQCQMADKKKKKNKKKRNRNNKTTKIKDEQFTKENDTMEKQGNDFGIGQNQHQQVSQQNYQKQQTQNVKEVQQSLQIDKNQETKQQQITYQQNQPQQLELSKNQLDKISIYEQLQSSQSICSSEWSNLPTTTIRATTAINKSGKSHPGFQNQSPQQLSQLQIQQKRSLSHKTDDINLQGTIIRPGRSNKKNANKKKQNKHRSNFTKNHNQAHHKLNKNNVDESKDQENTYEKQDYLRNQSSYLEGGSNNTYSGGQYYAADSSGYKQVDDGQPFQGKYQGSSPASNQDQIKASNQNDQPKNTRKRRKKNKTANIIKQLSNKISSDLITRQLNNFVDSLSTQTNNLYDHKRVAFERVRYFIQSIFPTTQAMLFGSNAVGLSLPTSDIDVMLFNLPCTTREQATEILAHLAVQIHTMGWVVSCSAYLNAKVPLVKLEIDPSVSYLATKRRCDYMMGPILDPNMMSYLELKPSKKEHKNNNINHHYNHHNSHSASLGSYHQVNYINKHEFQDHKQIHNNEIIKVDLSVNLNDQGNLGAQSTELMKSWMAVYPQIHRAILAFKYILAQRGYSSNFKGGIGSYCLFIMVAAFITQYPQLQNLDDGQFFMALLKFYGEQFQNQLKSISLISPHPLNDTDQAAQDKPTCFISLEQTYEKISYHYQYGSHITTYMHSPQEDSYHYLNTFKDNPLRIFDPINNRIMSGSCQLYPQIKAQFRRIYKQLKEAQQCAQKQVQLSVNKAEVGKMLQNKKSIDKWLNKYQIRSGFQIKRVFDGS